MSDGVVSTKFVANATDGERAIATLEKKYAELANKISDVNTKAKAEAIAAREALNKQARDAADAAKQKQRIEKQLQDNLKEERRNARREQEREERRAERAEREMRQDKLRAEREAKAEKRQLDRDTVRTQTQLLREAARDQKIIERDALRESLQAERERKAARKAASRERQREAKEEAREINRIRREAEREAERQDQESDRFSGKMVKWAMAAGGVLGVYTSIGAVVGDLLNATSELIKRTDEVADNVDRSIRGFRVQAGLTELEGEKAQASIAQVAFANAVPTAQAAAAATQLVSSGFTPEEASGPAANIVFQTMAGSNALDEDPKVFAQAMSQFLAATGQVKNVENLEKTAVAVQQAYRGTDMEASDLTQIAGKVESMAGKVSPNEILASFSVMRERTGKERASTAQQHFYQRLTGAADDPERVEQLAKLGLKPTDVDFIGESQAEVLDRLGTGLESLPPEARDPLMQRLFGIESAGGISGLIRDRGRLPEVERMLTNKEAFRQDAATATSGRAAARQRLAVKQEQQDLGFQSDNTLLLDEFQRLAVESGGTRAGNTVGRMFGRVIQNFTDDPRAASVFMGPGGAEKDEMWKQAIRNTLELKGNEPLVNVDPATDRYQREYLAEVKRNNELLKEQNDLMRAQAQKDKAEPAKRAKPVNADE